MKAEIASLKDEITVIKAQLAELTLKQVKKEEPAHNATEAQAILSSISSEVGNQLNVVRISFDPAMVWFQLIREDGTRISVKKQGNGLRVRFRSQSGELIKELTPAFNGLNAALLSLIDRSSK